MRSRLPILAILLFPILLLWPLPIVGASHILAPANSEASTHIWGIWAASQGGLPWMIEGHMARFPDGISLILVDPAHLAIFQIGQLFSPALGFNLIWLQGFWLLAIAGALLAIRVQASPWLGAILAMLSPPMLALPATGMTEAMGAGWVGIHLFLLLDWLDRGRLRSAILASLTLAAAAYTGPYNAVWISIIDLPLCLWWMGRGPGAQLRWRDRIRPVWVALVGFALTTPLLPVLTEQRNAELAGSAARGGIPEPMDQTDIFRGGIRNGADLTDPFLPGWLTGGEAPLSHTVYLGIFALGIGFWTIRRHPYVRPWLWGAILMLLLAMGPYWHIGGRTISIGESALEAPAGWLMHSPPWDRLTHWYRAGTVAHLLMVPVVALGLTHLRTPLKISACIAILLDSLFFAHLQWPLHHTPMPNATALKSLPDGRALLEFPPVTTGADQPNHWRDFGPLLQVQHGHPTGGSPMRLGISQTAMNAKREIEELLKNGRTGGRALHSAMDQGFGWVVFYPQYFGIDHHSKTNIERCLGEPFHRSKEIWVFSLDRSFPDTCIAPK